MDYASLVASTPPPQPGLWDKLMQTWPVRLAQGAWNAAKLPGDVYQGNVEVGSPEYYQRAADLAGFVTGGGFAAPAERNAVGMIKAYHGSPYDFERFDMSKIGTGEGAQAYGHGLYFAENPKVAEEYKTNLGAPAIEINGEKIAPKPGSPEDIALAQLENAHKVGATSPFGYAWHDVQFAKKLASEDRAPLFDRAADLLKEWQKVGAKPTSLGRTYEVQINADPEHFLDWDKPLSEQPPQIQPLLQEAIQKEAYNRALASTNKARADKLWSYVKDPMKAPAGFAQDLLKKPEVATQLREAGIPGIKYLDQGSRGSGQGTSNYVLFRDDIIDILKKYGLAGLTAAGAAGALGQGDRSQ